jgi:hypothetical protein
MPPILPCSGMAAIATEDAIQSANRGSIRIGQPSKLVCLLQLLENLL